MSRKHRKYKLGALVWDNGKWYVIEKIWRTKYRNLKTGWMRTVHCARGRPATQEEIPKKISQKAKYKRPPPQIIEKDGKYILSRETRKYTLDTIFHHRNMWLQVIKIWQEKYWNEPTAKYRTRYMAETKVISAKEAALYGGKLLYDLEAKMREDYKRRHPEKEDVKYKRHTGTRKSKYWVGGKKWTKVRGSTS